MTWFTIKILADNGDEVGNWMQLLIFVIIVVFSGIASLFKQKGVQPPPKKPTQAQRMPAEKKRAQPQKQTIEERVRLAAERMQAHRLVQKPQVAPAVSAKPKEAFQKPAIEKPQVAAPAQKETTIYERLELAEIEDIQVAILHYEILGPPVSMREHDRLAVM